MELADYRKSYYFEKLRQVFLCAGMLLIFVMFFGWYQSQATHINEEMLLTRTKSNLVSHLHEDMYAFTSTQLRLVLNDAHHEKKILNEMVGLVNDYLITLYQFEQIADLSDTDLLYQFKSEFNRWHQINNNLLAYLYNVSDPAARNALASINLALERLNPGSSTRLAALYQTSADSEKIIHNVE